MDFKSSTNSRLPFDANSIEEWQDAIIDFPELGFGESEVVLEGLVCTIVHAVSSSFRNLDLKISRTASCSGLEDLKHQVLIVKWSIYFTYSCIIDSIRVKVLVWRLILSQ
jgi:hypothetical protein